MSHLKYFFIGWLIGLLGAPDRGAALRQRLVARARTGIGDLAGRAGL